MLIRFSNDLEYTVDAMDFTVIQMDSAGKVLANTEIGYDQMHFSPGSTYITSSGIVVDEYCTDFRVVFSTVRSGRYVYDSRSGHTIVRYLRKETQLEIGKASGKVISQPVVQIRRFGKPQLSVLLVTVGLAVMLGLSVCDAYVRYYEFKHPAPEEQETQVEDTWAPETDTAVQE
ncbi:MAG: hypothetical protein IJW70_11645 [Clostridia bacterium]|nr:hypothetical protein [Clostridia bacterium]